MAGRRKEQAVESYNRVVTDCPICHGQPGTYETGVNEREFEGVRVFVNERWLRCPSCGEEWTNDTLGRDNEWALAVAVIRELKQQIEELKRAGQNDVPT